jgi:hypothetical protein
MFKWLKDRWNYLVGKSWEKQPKSSNELYIDLQEEVQKQVDLDLRKKAVEEKELTLREHETAKDLAALSDEEFFDSVFDLSTTKPKKKSKKKKSKKKGKKK